MDINGVKGEKNEMLKALEEAILGHEKFSPSSLRFLGNTHWVPINLKTTAQVNIIFAISLLKNQGTINLQWQEVIGGFLRPELKGLTTKRHKGTFRGDKYSTPSIFQ